MISEAGRAEQHTIRAESDIVAARHGGRRIAGEAGFGATDLTLIATAISEVAKNIIDFAGSGEIRISLVEVDGRTGLEIVATDAGPGINDVHRALEDGFSTEQGLGLGLPGARRLMDEFALESEVGKGTTVTMCKWRAVPSA